MWDRLLEKWTPVLTHLQGALTCCRKHHFQRYFCPSSFMEQAEYAPACSCPTVTVGGVNVVCRCAHPRRYTWEPKADSVFLYGSPPYLLFIYLFWSMVSHRTWSLPFCLLGWPMNLWGPPVSVPSTGATDALWVIRVWIQALTLVWQALYPLNHFHLDLELSLTKNVSTALTSWTMTLNYAYSDCTTNMSMLRHVPIALNALLSDMDIYQPLKKDPSVSHSFGNDSHDLLTCCRQYIFKPFISWLLLFCTHKYQIPLCSVTVAASWEAISTAFALLRAKSSSFPPSI